ALVGPMIWIKDANAQWSNAPEKGAKLRVLRWSRFVQGDIDQYMKNVAKFQEKYGIEVRVDNEGWEDVRPKAAVAAKTGAGPDIDSPQPLTAVECAKQLYATSVPATLSWLDPNNNKAFLDRQLFLTNNGISIYYAAKNSPDPQLKEMALDISHANMPIGPVGKPTEFHLFFNQMIFKYSKYPKAAKEFLRFMME